MSDAVGGRTHAVGLVAAVASLWYCFSSLRLCNLCLLQHLVRFPSSLASP